MRNKLYKSRNDKVLSGVIGGFAEAYYFDTTLLRIIYTAVTLFTGFSQG
ncbi:PspC domain-containing protein [Pediococcus pentosaceus]